MSPSSGKVRSHPSTGGEPASANDAARLAPRPPEGALAAAKSRKPAVLGLRAGSTRAQLGQAYRALGRPLEIAAHELRNPLAGVSGILQLLHERLRSTRDDEWLELVETAQGEVRRLATLLTELVEAERTGRSAAAVPREPCDLRDIVKAAVRPMLFGTHAIILDMGAGCPIPVLADHGGLEQVFRNLLANAAKYSEPKSPIRVSLRREPEFGVASVRDQGVGIPTGEVDQIFEQFYRGSNILSGGPGGEGLGLFVCRQIVEAHGGSIWAQCEGDVGASVHVRLPLAADVSWPEC